MADTISNFLIAMVHFYKTLQTTRNSKILSAAVLVYVTASKWALPNIHTEDALVYSYITDTSPGVLRTTQIYRGPVS